MKIPHFPFSAHRCC